MEKYKTNGKRETRSSSKSGRGPTPTHSKLSNVGHYPFSKENAELLNIFLLKYGIENNECFAVSSTKEEHTILVNQSLQPSQIFDHFMNEGSLKKLTGWIIRCNESEEGILGPEFEISTTGVKRELIFTNDLRSQITNVCLQK